MQHHNLYTLDQVHLYQHLGITPETTKTFTTQHEKGVLEFANQIKEGRFPAFSCVQNPQILQQVEGALATLSKFEHVIVVGIGGSSLSGRLFANVVCPNGVGCAKKLYFVDAPDHTELTNLCAHLPLKKTAIVAISKSGNTLETLLATGLLLTTFRQKKTPLKGRLWVLSEQNNTPLAQLCQNQDGRLLRLDKAIGGRYSAFSPVGLLIGGLAGIDVYNLTRGAAMLLNTFIAGPLGHDALQHAIGSAFAQKEGLASEVFMPYSKQLALLPEWWAQLWAESLGKEGKGITPIKALGPVDQHSQLQLYLDGPADKLYTLMTIRPNKTQEEALSATMAGLANTPILKGLSAACLTYMQATATKDIFCSLQKPVRELTLKKLDAFHLGGVMMHFMLATALLGVIWRVNPFDQPAIEQVKLKTKAYLAEGC